jgi:hypothetical protein
VKDWPVREDFVPGKYDVRNAPLVNPKKVLLPPLHKVGTYEELCASLRQKW